MPSQFLFCVCQFLSCVCPFLSWQCGRVILLVVCVSLVFLWGEGVLLGSGLASLWWGVEQGVLVHGPGSSIILRGNHLASNGEMGVGVQNGADARLEKNRVSSNVHAGIFVDGVASRNPPPPSPAGPARCPPTHSLAFIDPLPLPDVGTH